MDDLTSDLTTPEAAKLLGLTRDGVFKLITRGLLPAVRHESPRGPYHTVRRADVEALLRDRREQIEERKGKPGRPPKLP